MQVSWKQVHVEVQGQVQAPNVEVEVEVEVKRRLFDVQRGPATSGVVDRFANVTPWTPAGMPFLK